MKCVTSAEHNIGCSLTGLLSDKMNNRAFDADCHTLCVTQTPLRLNHPKSSMLFCPTRGTTFYYRWATSSPPSCCWSSLSCSSSSSYGDINPKVWNTSGRQHTIHCCFILMCCFSFVCVFSVLSTSAHEVSENTQAHIITASC